MAVKFYMLHFTVNIKFLATCIALYDITMREAYMGLNVYVIGDSLINSPHIQ
jgi:hypothetical protein